MTPQAKPPEPEMTLAFAGSGPTSQRKNFAPWAGVQLLASDRPLSEASILVVESGSNRAAAEAVLKAGNSVIFPAPDDLVTLRQLAEIGGNLHAPGRFRHTEVGSSLIEQLKAGVAGQMLSLYAALRGPAGGAPGLGFTSLLWDAVCMLDDCLEAPVAAIHTAGGALFSQAEDSAVIIAESANGVIATIDVANCLTSSTPSNVFPEIEIEVMGSQSTLRAAPFDRSVVVATRKVARTEFWGDIPANSMIAAATGDHVPEIRRLLCRLDIADAVIASLRGRDAIRLSEGHSCR